MQKFRALNLRSPTQTAKLSENKTHAKISGSTVPWEATLSKAPPGDYIMKNRTDQGNTQET